MRKDISPEAKRRIFFQELEQFNINQHGDYTQDEFLRAFDTKMVNFDLY